MTNIQSKIIDCSCQEFVHPWTDSCVKSVAGFIIQGSHHSLKIYSIVHVASLILKRKIPSYNDICKMVLGILQSSAFLTTNGAAFIGFMCLWRKLFGHWTFLGATFWPCFFASGLAYIIEKPSRRVLLTLYVLNGASDTMWKILESQGYVKNIPNGEVLIFATGMSILLYLFKLGIHRHKPYNDQIFKVIGFIIGHKENNNLLLKSQNTEDEQVEITNMSKIKHKSCTHDNSCLINSIFSGFKPFLCGLSAATILEIASTIKSKNKRANIKRLFNPVTLNLGIFLGGFSFLYQGTMCIFRHFRGKDDPIHAIPSAAIASIAALKYKSNFISLYVFLKALQLLCYLGASKGCIPNIPNFQMLLYSVATAILFHAAQFQPNTLRPSYWKFLFSLSGSRVALFNRLVLEKFGFNSLKALNDILHKTKTFGKPLLWAMV